MRPGSNTATSLPQTRCRSRRLRRFGATTALAATMLLPSAAAASTEAGARTVRTAPAAKPVVTPAEAELVRSRRALIEEIERRLSDTAPVRRLAAPIPEPEPEPEPTTTTTAPAPDPEPKAAAAPAPKPAPAPAPQPKPQAPAVGPGVWDQLAQCESGGNWAINTGNGYYGGLQFSLSSWQAVGGTGYPHQASREVQIQMGERLKARQGWGAWPACSRKLGLR